MPRGGRRPGAGRKPGVQGKWTAEAKEFRAKLRSMGKSPLEVLTGNMLANQEQCDRIRVTIGKLDLDMMDADKAKVFRGLLVEAAALEAVANSCADKLAPYMEPKRAAQDERIEMELPKIERVDDLPAAQDAILVAVTGGKISPEEGMRLSAIVEHKRKAIETLDQERRLAALEAKAGMK